MIKTFFKENQVHKMIVPNMDWLFIFKLPNFFILLMIFCWGMGSAYYSGINSYVYFSTDINFDQILFFVGLFSILGGINIQNQLDELTYLLDWPLSDSNDYQKKIEYTYVCPNFINIKYAKICSVTCIFIGVLIVSVYSFFTLGLLILYCYLNLFLYKHCLKVDSYKQLIFKCFFTTFSNFVLFLSGWLYFDVNSYIFAIKYTPLFVLAILPIILINEIISYDNFSKREKEKRIFIYNDRRNIAVTSLLLMSLLFFYSYYFLFTDPITSHFSIITIPFLIYTVFRSEYKDYIRSFIYPILVLNILLSWTLFPFLFVAQLIIFYLSKYYYWHRFSIHFPKFAIDEND